MTVQGVGEVMSGMLESRMSVSRASEYGGRCVIAEDGRKRWVEV